MDPRISLQGRIGTHKQRLPRAARDVALGRWIRRNLLWRHQTHDVSRRRNHRARDPSVPARPRGLWAGSQRQWALCDPDRNSDRWLIRCPQLRRSDLLWPQRPLDRLRGAVGNSVHKCPHIGGDFQLPGASCVLVRHAARSHAAPDQPVSNLDRQRDHLQAGARVSEPRIHVPSRAVHPVSQADILHRQGRDRGCWRGHRCACRCQPKGFVHLFKLAPDRGRPHNRPAAIWCSWEKLRDRDHLRAHDRRARQDRRAHLADRGEPGMQHRAGRVQCASRLPSWPQACVCESTHRVRLMEGARCDIHRSGRQALDQRAEFWQKGVQVREEVV
eukprot:comp22179_c0_seq1/m.52190 comp22179_c0_seq1/g.52190  ORF comp22179_c0_seq1/g.52190 comp22179_c0_seq1/m.52190 type:complete len:330 (-) comp22179_c0_seq1:511-1500(-)